MKKSAEELLVGVRYFEVGKLLKTVVRVNEKTDAVCHFGNTVFHDVGNICEPFDFRTHIFMLPEKELKRQGSFTVELVCRAKTSEYFDKKGEKAVLELEYNPKAIVASEIAVEGCDRKLTLTGLAGGSNTVGERRSSEIYKTADGLPVRVFTLTVDFSVCTLLAGTPYGEPEFVERRIQTVMEEAEETARQGYEVLAATNADYFDMFGDCKPSGLCVSRGEVVTNPNSDRPFFGIDKNGNPVISTLAEFPLERLQEAVGGNPIIVADGKIGDVVPLEPFGETPHPRTAAGIRADGSVIIMVVDGRRKLWSNGATLTELAKLMISHGAVTAINLDGGGSSTFIVQMAEGLTMLNHPADLARPDEDLIRPVFNSLIVVKKL